MAHKLRTVIFFFMSFSLSRSTCHSTLDTRPSSLDHLISPVQHRLWNRQSDLLCRLQVHIELKLRRLFRRRVVVGFSTKNE